jgi:hypothetical protein
MLVSRPYPRWLGCGRCGRDPPWLLGRRQERAGGDPAAGLLVAPATAVALMGGRSWSPRAAAPMSTGSPRLIRARPSILGGEAGPPISAPIKFGVFTVIPGFGMPVAGGGTAFPRVRCPASASHRRSRALGALGAPDTCLVSGAVSRSYPGHRSTRRPVPAGLERNEA